MVSCALGRACHHLYWSHGRDKPLLLMQAICGEVDSMLPMFLSAVSAAYCHSGLRGTTAWETLLTAGEPWHEG